MKQEIIIVFSVILSLLYFRDSHSVFTAVNGTIPTDTSIIDKGESSFNRFCVGCHNFRQDGIGPQLGGLTSRVSPEWIKHFIKNPQKIINSGDERALQMYKKFKTVMPSFTAFGDSDLNAIIAFLNTQKQPDLNASKKNGKELINPIPQAIGLSNLVVGLQLITQFPSTSDSNKVPLARITKLDFQPATGTSFILDLRGKLYKLASNKPTLYMDMTALKPQFIDHPGLATGFGSFAFHPQFATNGLLYTTHSEPAGSAKADYSYDDSIKVTLQWVLTEWKTNNPGSPTFSGKGRELLRINMVAVNHGVQEITFNPLATPKEEDYGLLYIGVGDGGSVENGYSFLAHSPEKIWGTVLRIDPMGRNSANGQYGIPPQNPFAKSKNAKALGEVYAYGFRNPHRITWSKTKQMLVSNIGHGSIESVNLIVRGHDYGWPIREGNFLINTYGDLNSVYSLPVDDSSYHVSYPVVQYDHDEGNAISGGYEYWGTAIPQLKGKYLFGDIPLGRLFYIDMADIKQGRQALIKEWKVSIEKTQKSLVELCGSKRVDLHFGRDAQGELYLLTKADGRLYKIVSATTK
ncbi:MAG: PQQ-dependent sugar dehydrogenase [Chitinophagaceae bacterium]